MPGIPTCDYEKPEASAAKLRREMGLPVSSKLSEERRPAACQSNQLAVHPEHHSALGAGTLRTKILVVYSPYPCTLAGFPAVVALGRGGRVVEAARQVSDLGPGHRRSGRVVTLKTGRPAFFFVADHGAIASSRCEPAATHALRVRPPGMRRRTIVAYRMGYCPSPKGDLGL